MVFSETPQPIDSAHAHRECFAAQHLRPTLVLVVQQTPLRRGSLTLCDSASPNRQQSGYDAADHESYVTDSRAEGVLIAA